MADDIAIPPEAVAWIEGELITYFESGGNELPEIGRGFDGAEIHAHYELSQKRPEHQNMDDMLDALSSAIFKTTGDEQFKVEEKVAEAVIDYGTMKREKYEPENKYKVPQFGDVGSSTMNTDDTNA